jgi:hypothetical protein
MRADEGMRLRGYDGYSAAKHDPDKVHEAFANPGGRSKRINAAN